MKTSALFALLAIALATVTACQPTASSLHRSESDPTDDESPSANAQKPKKPGETPSQDPATGGPAPAGKPLDPNGFTAKIAPLLDAQGCTECHHAGRPIDLTKYPFMAGDDKDTADRLTRSLAGTMPPAPRDRAPASLTDAVAAWRTAGMKP